MSGRGTGVGANSRLGAYSNNYGIRGYEISKGVLLPTVRQPITKLQLTRILFTIKGLISAFLSKKHQKK